MNFFRNHKGFSLLELIVSITIVSILFALVIINLLNVKQKASLSTSIDTLITDIRNQQLKAMVGDTEGQSSMSNLGIYFATDRYTLFHGNYSPTDPSNFTITLGDNIVFGNISFPSSQVVFASKSGEVIGVTGNQTIVVQDSQEQEQKTLTVNKFGVITEAN